MTLSENFRGLQHIGIPTNDIEQTISFYSKLGFEIALRTVNQDAVEQVAFLKLGNLMIETYENNAAALCIGAINQIAIDVNSIDEAFDFINENGLNNTSDVIHFLPFWKNGVKFFTIEGPNLERIEFSQYL